MEVEKVLPHPMGHFRTEIMQCIKILAFSLTDGYVIIQSILLLRF